MDRVHARFNLQRGAFRFQVDLDLPNSGVTAIFGHSGSGKTTLLRCISGLESAKDGFLKVGTEIWQEGSHFVPTHKRSLGYVFQETLLFPHLNVAANLRFGMKRAGIHDTSQLDHSVRLMEIEKLLNRRTDSLSGGERQRVAIARALAVNPKILLMDEPLSGLDDKLKQEIIPHLEQLHRESRIPILYVSHAKEEVLRLADYLVLMENGRVTKAGEASAIQKRPWA